MTDEKWKELLGDFECCPICGQPTKGSFNAGKGHEDSLTCGKHWYDHKYLISFQREKYAKAQ